MRARWLDGVVMVAALGCSGSVGGHKIAPVSGVVLLNGRPLANATVSFQPVAPKGSLEAGPGSTGKTNEKGEFSLVLTNGKAGAVVGQHRVQISLLASQPGQEDRRGGPKMDDLIPARYGPGQKEELKFDVPDSGTDKAEFALVSP
ncbi:MAG: hypothetical protein ACJ8F7_00340 [Gemmataceae bacterium]